MNNKIIGFTISKDKIDHNNVDIFKIGLSKLVLYKKGFFVYLWGLGDLRKCFLDKNIITMSFPIHDSLEDRNVIISIKNNHISIENDWLGSIPIFYNKEKFIVSTLIEKTYPDNTKNIDSEGLYNYLEFGYCVLEKTPFKETSFMRYFSEVILSNNRFEIIYKDDPFIKTNIINLKSSDVINIISKNINQTASKINGSVIIPTSGGNDSRLLNLLLSDRKRIKSFTYGITNKGKLTSCEVARAKKLSEILGTSWKEIKLANFHKYYKPWFRLFGCSTHLHGMYQIEFYKKLVSQIDGNKNLLSGIFGDVWSGKVDLKLIKKFEDIYSIGYSHNLSFSGKFSKFKIKNKKMNVFYNKNKDIINFFDIRPIIIVRFKIILISYLMSIPDYLGIPSWTPFLNYNVAQSILRLGPDGRNKRIWQSEYFKKMGIWHESMKIVCTDQNTLNEEGLLKINLPEIDINVLSKYIKKVSLYKSRLSYRMLLKYPKYNISKIVWLFNKIGQNRMDPYNHILVLKSLEMADKSINNDKN